MPGQTLRQKRALQLVHSLDQRARNSEGRDPYDQFASDANRLALRRLGTALVVAGVVLIAAWAVMP